MEDEDEDDEDGGEEEDEEEADDDVEAGPGVKSAASRLSFRSSCDAGAGATKTSMSLKKPIGALGEKSECKR